MCVCVRVCVYESAIRGHICFVVMPRFGVRVLLCIFVFDIVGMLNAGMRECVRFYVVNPELQTLVSPKITRANRRDSETHQ